MRLAVCALSAVMLSGCSWLGGFGGGGQGGNIFGNSSQYSANNGSYRFDQHNPCVIPSPRAPIPRGCNPANVTIGTASGGFPQQPNFGNAQYADAGFGSHAGVAGQQSAYYQPQKRLKKPKFRGTLSLGLEKSISGDLINFDEFANSNPAANYNPNDFREFIETGSPQSGQEVDTLYTALIEDASTPDITFNNVHSTPLSIKGGVEYIFSPKTTVFANAGYGYAEGNNHTATAITGELLRVVDTRNFVTVPGIPSSPEIPGIPAIPDIPAIPGIPATPFSPAIPGSPPIPGSPAIPGTPAVQGTPDTFSLSSDTSNTSFIPNVNIANFSYAFSDQNRVDLEVGARHYLNPIVKDQGFKTLTPFVGASIGATYHNAVSFDVTQNQLFYQRAFESGGETLDFFDVPSTTTTVEVFDSEWVPTGQLNAGMEWQVTPKTALAFGTGLRFEGSRDFVNGDGGSDTNIAIPVTVRGSYNF